MTNSQKLDIMARSHDFAKPDTFCLHTQESTFLVSFCLMQGKSGHSPSAMTLSTLPTHIAQIKKTGLDHIICGALSPDGSRIAFSDQAGLHLYQLSGTTAAANALSGAGGEAEEEQDGEEQEQVSL